MRVTSTHAHTTRSRAWNAGSAGISTIRPREIPSGRHRPEPPSTIYPLNGAARAATAINPISSPQRRSAILCRQGRRRRPKPTQDGLQHPHAADGRRGAPLRDDTAETVPSGGIPAPKRRSTSASGCAEHGHNPTATTSGAPRSRRARERFTDRVGTGSRPCLACGCSGGRSGTVEGAALLAGGALRGPVGKGLPTDVRRALRRRRLCGSNQCRGATYRD